MRPSNHRTSAPHFKAKTESSQILLLLVYSVVISSICIHSINRCRGIMLKLLLLMELLTTAFSSKLCYQCFSVQLSRSVVSDSLQPHELQHARPPCPSPTPGVHSDSTSIESVMPSSRLILCHPLLLLPPIPPSIRVFSNESTLHMRLFMTKNVPWNFGSW